MASIDDRVVGMKFDNANFEQKLGDTLKSLNKLQQSLDFSNSKRGMDELSKASSNFNMGNMGSAVEGISAKFLALSTIAITALATITSKAVEAGGRMLKALSIKPIMEGFQEYEVNMNSIQTILANTKDKGSTLNDVNDALEKLNQYSDQTIYNFAQMARNVGTFTAAGVDLDKSVNSIKGIANLAAISGSNSEQASTAMYQLSQALSAGKVSLMDWNSVVNAGMGGEVFKKALFETGKAMKTITDVPLGASFEDWEKKGGTFREQMQSGWLTADVLSTTLESFSGDLDEAALKQLGFGDAAAKKMVELGKLGIAAATEVKTMTQLMGTVKEAIASGWSKSFKLVIGDFEQAKKLFTEINAGIGGMVGKSADARNALLEGWVKLGGRDQLIEGFRNAIQGLGSVIAPVKEAFREIFPPMTAQRLLELTQSFVRFTEGLKVSSETASTIKSIFAGLFAAIEIGWTIVKGVAGLIGDVIGQLTGATGGSLKFAAGVGDTIVALNKMLVDGGGIKRFFEAISEAIRNPVEFFNKLKENILELAQTFPGFAVAASIVTTVIEKFGARFEHFTGIAEKASERWQGLTRRLEAFGDAVSKVFSHLSTWFKELGSKISEALQPEDFDAAVDIVNVGLLGGILLMIKKFMGKLTNMDFTGGILSKVTEALDGVTGSLKAMQADLRAGALMKIAAAVGILTISIVALSLINSEALAKALTAIAVGFAQLIIVMSLMEKATLGTGAIRLGILAAGMILLATAMAVLSIAVKNLSSLGWEELAKGLVGVTVMLVALTTSTQLIAANTAGMIRAGIAMSFMAVALNILALAVKSFSELSWTEMAKGLVAVGVGLGLIVVAMNFMPTAGMLASGVAIIAIATGLRILAEAVAAFSTMSWTEMAKGLAGVGAGLIIIAGAMHLMPPGMVFMAAGLLALSVALNIMAAALKILATMTLSEIANSLLALSGMLLVLSLAMNSMTGAIAGAAALVIVSGSLIILAGALKILSKMSLGEIAKGLGAVAAVLAVLGIAAALLTPVIPALYSLGVALSLVGVAFGLFGIGAFLVAKAFTILAAAGLAGVTILIEVIKKLIGALPEFVEAFIQALGELIAEIGTIAALIAKVATVVLNQLLDTIIELAPKIAEALGVILTEGLKLIREKLPEVVQTGVEIVLAFLRGIRDNMGSIVTTAVEVIANFATTMSNNAQKLVDAALTLVFSFIQAIGNRANDIVAAGLGLLVSFILGISNNLSKITDVVGFLILRFIYEVGTHVNRIVRAGSDIIVSVIKGIGDKAGDIVTAGVDTIIKFIEGLGKNALKLANAAAEAILDFINGLTRAINTYAPQLRAAGVKLAGAIVDGMTFGLASKVGDVAKAAGNMASSAVSGAKKVLSIFSPSKVFKEIGENVGEGFAIGISNNNSAENNAVEMAERVITAFQESLSRIPNALGNMDEFHPVITPVLDLTKVQAASRGLNRLISDSSITPDVSIGQARLISKSNELNDTSDETTESSGLTEIKFEQNNYSPAALTVNDIYRNTKSQIALAKEELNI